MTARDISLLTIAYAESLNDAPAQVRQDEEEDMRPRGALSTRSARSPSSVCYSPPPKKHKKKKKKANKKTKKKTRTLGENSGHKI